MLAPLGSEIRRLVLACLSGFPVAGALHALDVDRDKLSDVINNARRPQTPAAPNPETIREIRRLLALPGAP